MAERPDAFSRSASCSVFVVLPEPMIPSRITSLGHALLRRWFMRDRCVSLQRPQPSPQLEAATGPLVKSPSGPNSDVLQTSALLSPFPKPTSDPALIPRARFALARGAGRRLGRTLARHRRHVRDVAHVPLAHAVAAAALDAVEMHVALVIAVRARAEHGGEA